MTSLFGRLLVTVSDFKTGIAEADLISNLPFTMYKHSTVIILKNQDAVSLFLCFCNKMSYNTEYEKKFILKMLNKACDHNDGVINTNRITKQPTVK